MATSSLNFRMELSSTSHIVPTADYGVVLESYQVTDSEDASDVVTYASLLVLILFG